MSESLDRPIDVPELTAEEIQARVLHRDGLMLVIDKPAGLPVHRGPKGGANLESSFDALRFGLPRPPVLAHRLDQRYLRLPGARTPSQGDRLARAVVQAWQDFQDLLGGGRRRPGRGRRHHRHAARPPQRRARLVAEARSGRADGRHQLESAGTRRRPHLARAGTGHRPHPSIARACGGDGLADRRRQYLRQRPALRRADACICIPARS